MKEKPIVVIPARYASSRFEGKALADILGKPMIYHVCTRSALAKNIGKVIVATDDTRIKDVVESFGFEAVMTSPDHKTGTDRVAEVALKEKAKIIINVQGDEPTIQPETIEKVADAFLEDEDVYYAQAATEITNPDDFIDSTVVKIAVGAEDYAVFYSRSPIPYPKTRINYRAYKHVGVYGYRNEFLQTFKNLAQRPIEQIEQIEQLRAIEHGYKVKIVKTPYDTVSVDVPNDLFEVRAKMEEERSGGQ